MRCNPAIGIPKDSDLCFAGVLFRSETFILILYQDFLWLIIFDIFVVQAIVLNSEASSIKYI
ncbi:MAG: hypothetical protein CVT94_03770 [Bacteroidetes bacterium HGW-Bacteroidetes-11]|nr:MAG: hypothetical protein CVT94_03770 [Bacteroidetes bacterium HGW-Bacteroidetes-11]